MAAEDEGLLLGHIAVHHNMITPEQLAEASTVFAEQPDRFLADILYELGFVTATQMGELMVLQSTAQVQMKHGRAETERIEVPPEPVAEGTDVGIRAAPPIVEVEAELSFVDLDAPREEPQGGHDPGGGHDEIVSPARNDPEGGQMSPVRNDPRGGHDEIVSPVRNDPEPDHGGHVSPVRNDPDPEAVAALHKILAQGAEMGASDIHLHAGETVSMRRFTKLEPSGRDPLTPELVERYVTSILTPEQREILADKGQVDLAYSVDGVGRFRTNVYAQHRGLDAVFHCVPPRAASIKALGLPENIAGLTHHHQGLVLITGPAGCGKTSTLAALVNLINQERSDHILTIEDPIEYVHKSQNCLVNQRATGQHTDSFARALRAALREDPDVICIGELRDLETISLAMSAAETGHLVLGTLHTNNAIRTINRIIGAYPPNQQGQVRTMLSESLRAVFSQRLLPNAAGDGVELAYELLLINAAVSNLIRENRTFQLKSILQTGAAQGMRLLDISLTQLVNEGRITKQVAADNAENPESFR